MSSYLFVDGSNLYAGQYELFGSKKYLDFSKYINSIENSLNNKFEKIYFYASYSPRPKLINNKIKKYLINEYNFYKRVKSIKNLIFFKGYRSPTSGKEKEVDVKIAVDIVNMAHLNKYTNLYLMLGDADFLHALKVAESLRKWITIVALENRIPFRYSYLYKTYVFKFKEKLKIKIKKSQKIKIIKLENKITQFV